jgi:hypothetical protein
MIRNLLASIFLLSSIPYTAFAELAIRTERNALCGVELYEERYDGDVCGWVYFEKQTNACPLDYVKSGPDLSCPESDLGGRKISTEIRKINDTWTIEWFRLNGVSTTQGNEDIKVILGNSIPHSNSGSYARETSYWSCKASFVNTSGSSWYGGMNCTTKPYVASCPLEKFGKVYKPCRHESHDKESPKKCRSDKFAAERYNSCSFYKTPEEIDAFIEATYGSLAINSASLPSKQADVYGTFRQEATFVCLIEKYSGLEGYDDVAADLIKKFKEAFGYPYTDSSRTCADAANEAIPTSITAGALNCSDYTLQSIKTLAKPEAMNLLVFNRFKSTCTTKLSYDLAVSWFDEKLLEINQLLADVVAKKDTERKEQLESLRTSVAESK